MSTTNPPEPKNPRHGRAAPELHTALLALSICLLVPTDAHLQTETGPPEQADRPTSTDTGGSGANPDNNDPRIYAQEPCMSNAPGSPKAFEGTVMRTTQNGVHFRVDFHDANSRQKMGYFLFELRGLAGREKIRIDFVNVGRWGNSRSIVPMYSQGVEQMSSPELLWSNIPSDGQYEYVRTQTGQKIPRTHGLQNWHYFKEVKIEKGYDEKQLTVRHVIPSNTRHMYVAHRIPYTFSYHKYYMNKLREKAKYGSDHLTVHLVGKSKGGRPLHVVELENPSDPDAREKPVVVLTAGEHPDEHSTYHVMKGALDFLTSDHQEAELLRQKATFLFVPVLDPDGLMKCMYENVCYSFSRKADFHPGTPTRTSLAYAKWFRQWANRSRLDTHILLHNVESGETSDHVFNYLIEPESARHQIHYEYWKHVANYLEKGGFHVDKSRPDTGMTPNRLGGFLRWMQGTMQLFLELNSQPKPPGHKLTLAQQQKLGRYLVASVVDYLYSSKSQELRNILRDERRIRWRYVDRYETILQNMEKFASKNALDREAAMVAMPSYERHHLQLQKGKDVGFEDREYDGIHWVRYMYNNYDISPSNFPGALQIDEK